MKRHLLLLAICLMATAKVQACSCVGPGDLSEEEQIEKEFSEADAVLVARVVKVKQSLVAEDLSGRHRIEDAHFVVAEVLKGSHKVDETIHVRSNLGGGACGRSARNDPPWLEMISETVPSVSSVAVLSDEWLLYVHGSQPYNLSNCSRSFPMNLRGGEDAEYLRGVLARKNGGMEQ
jgi:hypothetical protein